MNSPITLDESGLEAYLAQREATAKVIKLLTDDCEWLRKAFFDIRADMPTRNPEGYPLEDAIKRGVAFMEIDRIFRFYVRAVFALIEGAIYNNKLLAVTLPQTHRVFTEDEIKCAKEEGATSIRLLDNLNLMVELLNGAFNTNFTLNKSDNRFGLFKKAVAIRNGLMHPKVESDLKIDYNSLKFDQAQDWFFEQIGLLTDQCRAQFEGAQRVAGPRNP